jgi:diacylglycerol kinase
MGMVMKKIQMSTVLDVSIVDLCAALAFLVTLTPKLLNSAIERHMHTESAMSNPFAPKSWKARTVSSTWP